MENMGRLKINILLVRSSDVSKLAFHDRLIATTDSAAVAPGRATGGRTPARAVPVSHLW